MSQPTSPQPTVGPDLSQTLPTRPGVGRTIFDNLKSRILSGLLLAFPIVLTFWIVYQLYLFLNNNFLEPASGGVRYLLKFRPDFNPESTWSRYISPLIAIFLVLGLLYILGLFVRSRVHRMLDWILFRVPVVTTIYKALSNVFQSLGTQLQGNSFKRVVLVNFPHPGSKALAFVTRTLQDAKTERVILCVCVLTGVVPPAGFTLFVPEDEVIDIDWSVNQALQAILSGGITTPSIIQFSQGLRVSGVGPIVDPSGHPIIANDVESHDSV